MTNITQMSKNEISNFFFLFASVFKEMILTNLTERILTQ